MFDYSSTEVAKINETLEPKLEIAKTRVAETEQMALDATRLLSCTEGRLSEYTNQGFFKRCWYKLCGKQGEIQRANQKDLIEMQKYGWRYINLLQERDLLMAHSIITVKNNLMTLAIDQEETRKEIEKMANKVYERFTDLEHRVRNLEVSSTFHSWLLTIETYDYDKLPKYFCLLKVIQDFFFMKAGNWNIIEIKYLQKAIKDVGLPWTDNIKLSCFINELIDEIDAYSFSDYEKLLSIVPNSSKSSIAPSFVNDNVAVPSYASLFEIADKYTNSIFAIEVLQEKLSINKKDAIKEVLTKFIKSQGIDLEISIPLRDLSVEILSCMNLTTHLANMPKQNDNNESSGDVDDLHNTQVLEDQNYIKKVKMVVSGFAKGTMPHGFSVINGTLTGTLETAIQAYGNGVERDHVLMHLNDSKPGKGDKGLVLAGTNLYFSHQDGPKSIDFREINNVQNYSNKIIEFRLFKNQIELFELRLASKQKAEFLIDLFGKICKLNTF